MITIIVGEAETPFRVHQELLLQSGSNFFAACLENFFEAHSNSIRLPDDRPDVVRAYVDWLYSDKQKASIEESTSRGFRLYEFGDKILAEGFCNAVMDEIRAIYQKRKLIMSATNLCKAKSSLGESQYYAFGLQTILRSLKTKSASWKQGGKYKEQFDIISENKEVMADIIQGLLDLGEGPCFDPASLQGCHFHVHTDGSKCSAMNPSAA
jgi:hypothetical protein